MTALPRRRLLALGAAAALARPGHPRAAPVPVRVGFIPVIGVGQLFVLIGLGWARDAGLDLRPIPFDSGPAMISALASGTLDAYYGGIGPVMVAAGKGIAVKVVAASAVEELALVARGDFAKIAEAGTAAGFSAFAAAAGRTVKIATQPAGSVPDTVLRYWLETRGHIDPASYTILPMGIDQTQQALLSGAVDAADLREPALTIVKDRDPTLRVLVPGGAMMTDQPGSVLALTQALISRDRALTLVRLHIRATELLRKDPDSAAIPLQAGLGRGIIDAGTFARALHAAANQFEADPHRIRAATATLQDFQIHLGSLGQPADLDRLFDNSFYDAAITP